MKAKEELIQNMLLRCPHKQGFVVIQVSPFVETSPTLPLRSLPYQGTHGGETGKRLSVILNLLTLREVRKKRRTILIHAIGSP